MDTKTNILLNARALFVEHGFAGTSMGRIAKAAGVNHSLLFHHFGNKENLWLAVKQSIVEEAESQTVILPDITLPFANFIEEMVHRMYQFYQSNPDLVRMIHWQRLEYNNTNTIGIGSGQVNTATKWIEAFTHYQKNGSLSRKHPVEFVLPFILSVVASAAMDHNQQIKQPKKYLEFCTSRLIMALES